MILITTTATAIDDIDDDGGGGGGDGGGERLPTVLIFVQNMSSLYLCMDTCKAITT